MSSHLLLVVFLLILRPEQATGSSIEPPPGQATCPGLAIPIPRGEQGPAGTPGLAGKDGDTGKKGETGIPGNKGATGAKGDTGDKGATGAAGINGTQGLQGIKGEKGTAGTCDANRCARVSTLEGKLQELTANFTNQIDALKEKMDYLERNIKYPLGSEKNPAISCKEILARDKTTMNGHYYITVSGIPEGKIKVFCFMYSYDGNCPSGLTQVMKIDGSEDTFKYSSLYWINKASHKPENNGDEDDLETKLPTYWSTPFTKICLRMQKFGSQKINWRSIDIQGNSLYDLIAFGQNHGTSLGKPSWMGLLNNAKLQNGCLKEGINVEGKTTNDARARIGIIAGIDCDQTKSFIGFGTEGANSGVTCGNAADGLGDIIKSYGHIYVY